MDKEIYTFFLVVPPGLENIAAWELEQKLNLKGTLLQGGIELQAPLEYRHYLNDFLKVPNRVLQRVTSFRCRDLPKLFNKIKKIPWNSLLATSNVNFSISSCTSRLFDSRKIEQSVRDAIENYFKANTPPQKLLNEMQQKIYLRFNCDQLTISLDCSGDRLHQRGYRTLIGKAPLRENIAAALILALAPYCKSQCTLIDPMCGSGTFLLEAALINSNDHRSFLYPPVNNSFEPNLIKLPFKEFQGSDIDQKMIAIANDNAQHAAAPINLHQEDLFTSEKYHQEIAIICNPPYGKRIKSPWSLEQIAEQIVTKYHPQNMALLIPKQEKLSLPQGYQKNKQINFENGGLKVKFLIMTKIACGTN